MRFILSGVAALGLCSALLVAAPSPGAAQVQTPTTTVLSDLRTAYLAAAVVAPADSASMASLELIERSLNELEDRYVVLQGTELDSTYVTALNFNARLLSRAAEKPDSAAFAIAEVASDLSWKAYDVSRGVGWTAPSDEMGVEVTVRVRRNGQDVPGYYARANPRVFPPSAGAMFPFTNEAPTSKRLPSGNYIFWIEDVAGKLIQSRELTVSSIDDPEVIFVVQ